MTEKKMFFSKETKGKLVKDKRAVSPVIAEILMVAIVVILAAVIAAFVFGVGQPSAKVSPAYSLTRTNASYVTVVLHDMGGASEVKGHYVSIDGGAPTALDPPITRVGNTSTFEATAPAHIIITATVDGKDQVVIETAM